MDYKKKYEEALEKIKRYVTDEYGCIRLKPSDIFPELAESEDEKVRKEIIEVLQLTPTTTWERANTNYDRCFAWLEKQKEQKPIEWSEEDEENLDTAIDMVEHTLYEPLVPRDTLVSWLKSLKDRIKWK